MGITRKATLWTETEVPTTVNIKTFEGDWDHVKNLKAGLAQLMDYNGFLFAHWGRISEHPESVLLVAKFESNNDLEGFVTSPAYQSYLSSISILKPATSFTADFENELWFHALHGLHVQVTKVYIPHPVSDNQRNEMDSLLGLVRDFSLPSGQIDPTPLAYRAAPAKGWVREVAYLHSRPMQVVLWLHLWKSPEAEDKFKRTHRKSLPDGPDWEDHDIPTYWDTVLKSAGSVSRNEVHCHFIILGNPISDLAGQGQV